MIKKNVYFILMSAILASCSHQHWLKVPIPSDANLACVVQSEVCD